MRTSEWNFFHCLPPRVTIKTAQIIYNFDNMRNHIIQFEIQILLKEK